MFSINVYSNPIIMPFQGSWKGKQSVASLVIYSDDSYHQLDILPHLNFNTYKLNIMYTSVFTPILSSEAEQMFTIPSMAIFHILKTNLLYTCVYICE